VGLETATVVVPLFLPLGLVYVKPIVSPEFAQITRPVKLPLAFESTDAVNGEQVAASATPINQLPAVRVIGMLEFWLMLVAVTVPLPATAPGLPLMVTWPPESGEVIVICEATGAGTVAWELLLLPPPPQPARASRATASHVRSVRFTAVID